MPVDEAGEAVSAGSSAFPTDNLDLVIGKVSQSVMAGLGKWNLAHHRAFQIMPLVETSVATISRVMSRISHLISGPACADPRSGD